ncbi:hypothetical protein CP967_19895 [Streptomyces nitrosporeus]|uniref:Lipocalin-like domain-containing protein n=1 Tax=Streptomyces nitrosporeus TaxID=28894 RepID=A0A5J6FCD2_9ACTN|nr:hypothetical protein CP967_19895 [Streptomyces nitrosporeus]
MLTVTSSATAVAATPCSFSPVGTWTGTVTRPGASDQIQLAFGPSGRACLITTMENEVTTSYGAWQQSGFLHFNYKIKEALTDGNGTLLGWIHIDQDAVQQGSAFSSSGTSLVYDLAGNPQGSVTSYVTATKTSSTPLSCAAHS